VSVEQASIHLRQAGIDYKQLKWLLDILVWVLRLWCIVTNR